MPARDKTLADGQLSATSATILSGDSVRNVSSGRVTLTLANTVVAEQEIFVKFQRDGGTARLIAHAVLEKYQVYIVKGIAMQPDDTLVGYAGSADVVDYLVAAASDETEFGMAAVAADGTVKQNAEVELEITEGSGLTRDGVAITAELDEIKKLLMKIA